MKVKKFNFPCPDCGYSTCPFFIRKCIGEFKEEYFRMPDSWELEEWIAIKQRRIEETAGGEGK